MAEYKHIILEKDEIARILTRMAHEVVEKTGNSLDVTLIGILTRGAHLASRIGRKIESWSGSPPQIGVVDITPYRDDVKRTPDAPPHSDVAVTVDDQTVVLVDDVINTGRTVRAALELLGHLGNPKKVIVASLIDRGHRELPIKADIVGKNVDVDSTERVNVLVQELDGCDQVIVSKIQLLKRV
jgi:pyrimidine operon attenuation protein/uracil phosphoribosyltransferase